jgi:hypothetical protein
MKVSFVLGAVLSLSCVCFAGQKSYTVTFSAPITVGGVRLAAGEYKLKVDGANAIFTNSNNKKVNAPVKVETVAAKFEATAVDSSTDNGGMKVNAIELGGSNTKLEFGD